MRAIDAVSFKGSAGIEFDELVEGLRRGVAVLEHPKKVLEQHHLAAHDDGAGVVVRGALADQDLEERVVDETGADEVPPAGLADVDGAETGGGIVRMLAVVVVGSEAAAGVPPLEHGPQPVELAGHEFNYSLRLQMEQGRGEEEGIREALNFIQEMAGRSQTREFQLINQ